MLATLNRDYSSLETVTGGWSMLGYIENTFGEGVRVNRDVQGRMTQVSYYGSEGQKIVRLYQLRNEVLGLYNFT